MPETLPQLEYPSHFEVRKVSASGTIRMRHQRFLSTALKGEWIGLEETDDGIWDIVFFNTEFADTGRFDFDRPEHLTNVVFHVLRHAGVVVLEDDVEIGANTAVDRRKEEADDPTRASLVEPVRTDSPRQTMKTFLRLIEELEVFLLHNVA